MAPWWLRVDAVPKPKPGSKPGSKRELEPGKTYAERDTRTRRMTLVRKPSSSSRRRSAAATREVVDEPSARPAQQRPSAPAAAEVLGPLAMPFSGPQPPYGPYPPPGYLLYPSTHPLPPTAADQPYVGSRPGYHGARTPPPPQTRPVQPQPSRPVQPPLRSQTRPSRPTPPAPTTTERGPATTVNDRTQEPKNVKEAPSREAARASGRHQQRSELSSSSAPRRHGCLGCGKTLPNFCRACISESVADDARDAEGAAVRDAKQVRFQDDHPGRRYPKEQWAPRPESSSSDDRNANPRRDPVKSYHRSRRTRDEKTKEDRESRGHVAQPKAVGHRASQGPSPDVPGVLVRDRRPYPQVLLEQRLQDPGSSGLVSPDARHRPSTMSSRNRDDAQLLEARMRFARLRDADDLIPARFGSPELATTRRRRHASPFTAAQQLARRRAAETSGYWFDPYANPWATSSEDEYQQAWRDDAAPMPTRHAVHDPPAARAVVFVAPAPRLPYPPGYRPPYVESPDEEYSSEQRA